MTDRTILGYGFEPHEVAAVLDSLVGERDSGEDPLAWYSHLSSRQALFSAAVDELRQRRRRVVAELYDSMEDRSYQRVADHLGVSRAQAQQMIEQGRAG